MSIGALDIFAESFLDCILAQYGMKLFTVGPGTTILLVFAMAAPSHAFLWVEEFAYFSINLLFPSYPMDTFALFVIFTYLWLLSNTDSLVFISFTHNLVSLKNVIIAVTAVTQPCHTSKAIGR